MANERVLVGRSVFLGHVVTKEGIKVGPQKVKAIIEWSKPTNIDCD